MKEFQKRIIALNTKAYDALIVNKPELTIAVCFNTAPSFIQAWFSIFNDLSCINHQVDDHLFEGIDIETVFKKMDEYLDVQLERIDMYNSNINNASYEDTGYGD